VAHSGYANLNSWRRRQHQVDCNTNGRRDPATGATSALRPAPRDQLVLVADRLHEILSTGGTFDPVYRHILAAPGKRVRAGLVMACARLLPSTAAVPRGDAVDMARAMKMFHESGQRHPPEKRKR